MVDEHLGKALLLCRHGDIHQLPEQSFGARPSGDTAQQTDPAYRAAVGLRGGEDQDSVDLLHQLAKCRLEDFQQGSGKVRLSKYGGRLDKKAETKGFFYPKKLVLVHIFAAQNQD